MFLLNDKPTSVQILKNYFQKIDIKELPYYLDIKSQPNIPDFLEKNVYEPDQIELTRLLKEHLDIVTEILPSDLKKSLFDKFTQNNLQIKISFVTEHIYWSELFSIEDNIFISYPYLIMIFDRIELNDYKKVSEVYIKNDKIYDVELLKKISECVISVTQYFNQDYWIDLIGNQLGCEYVEKNKIHFSKKHKILHEPNSSFTYNYIPVYKLGKDKFFCAINYIYSETSFCPYWNDCTIQLDYLNGEYIEIQNDLTVESGLGLGLGLELEPNPMALYAKHITLNILSV